MITHNAPVYASFLRWGDRTRLLPKALVYALSLDFGADSAGNRLQVVERSSANRLFHLFSHAVITTPDGAACDVPTGTVAWGELDIGDQFGISRSWLNLRLQIDLEAPNRGETRAALAIQSGGVLDFDGGLNAFESRDAERLTGATFITTTQQSSTAAYRWLDRRQLFGVGRVDGTRKPKSKDEWCLNFQFDLYTAG